MLVSTTNDAWGAIYSAHTIIKQVLKTPALGSYLNADQILTLEEVEVSLTELLNQQEVI